MYIYLEEFHEKSNTKRKIFQDKNFKIDCRYILNLMEFNFYKSKIKKQIFRKFSSIDYNKNTPKSVFSSALFKGYNKDLIVQISCFDILLL